MAELDAKEKLHALNPQIQIKTSSCLPFKFNAQAPEFVPRSQTQIPISSYNIGPYFQSLYIGTSSTNVAAGSDWFYVPDQDQQIQLLTNNPNVTFPNCSKNLLTEDLQKKIIRQAEYQFCDMSLLANESLMKHMSRDSEGFVSISIVANSKKIKSLVSDHHILAQALRASSKLVVSNDGKMVRRKHMFTDRDKEELLCRTIVAENLPEDHSHQNLEKIFNVVGSVKSIRICHPQESSSAHSKGDCIISNKLHALVEYANADVADKAVDTLSDERNWRKGLRVRVLHRRSPKSVLKSRKSDFDGYLDDEEALYPESSEDGSHQTNLASPVGNNVDQQWGSNKGWGRIRGKNKGRIPSNDGHGLYTQSPMSSTNSNNQCETSLKQLSKGPRMPDGTRGFSMGRGKSLTV